MFEIVQILWDLFVMRRDIQQGRLTLRRAAIAFGMTIVAYGTAVGAFVLYDRHPQYKPLFIAGEVFAAAVFVDLIYLGFHWSRQSRSQQSATIAAPSAVTPSAVTQPAMTPSVMTQSAATQSSE
jgi:hypothetical protein